MKRFLITPVLGLLAGSVAAADLAVTVTDLPSDAGTVRAAVYGDAASFAAQQNPVASVILKPNDKMVRVTLGNLPPGRYALAVFQDVNDNGKLDTNLLSMPTEPWGFSRDAVGNFGPPSFDQAAVELAGQGTSITIKVHS
jgi:uncharacterized protein (DUF2141 family)